MLRAFNLLVMVVALIALLAGAVTADQIPPYDPNGSTNGSGEGDDGDHPWGGDRIIGSFEGSTPTRTALVTSVTGYLAVDMVVTYLIERWAPLGIKGQNRNEALTSSAIKNYRATQVKGVSR